MLTDKDKDVLRHIETFKFVTIKQVQKLFYNELNHGYDYARKRLNKLVEAKYIKKYKDYSTNQLIFLDPEAKTRPSYHRVIVLDLYAELVSMGAEFEYFNVEEQWLNGAIRSDSYMIYTYEGYRYYDAVEVNLNKNKLNMNKYNELLYSSNCERIPRVVLVDSVKHEEIDIDEDIELIQIDYELKEIENLFPKEVDQREENEETVTIA